jgi:Ca2+/Na+ antiporter
LGWRILAYHFETDLTKEQIINRLSTFGDTGLNKIASSKDIIYKVKKNKIRLVKNIKTNYQAYLRPFYGEIESKDSKTYIRGEFKHSLFIRIYLIIWFGGVIIIGGIIFLGAILSVFTRIQEIGKSILGIVILPVMLGFGIFIFTFGRKKQEEWLISFIKEKFELKEIKEPV